MNKLSQAYNYHTLPKSPKERSASDEQQYAIRKEEQAFKELEQKLEREQAKKERELKAEDELFNRELSRLGFGAMVVGGE